MRSTACLLVLLATVSRSCSEKTPFELKWPLIFPGGTPPDVLLARQGVDIPVNRHAGETTGDCNDSCEDAHSTKESDDEWRLSKDVTPSHYDLHLDVHVDKFLFNGTVEITVTAQKTTHQITLHSDALSIVGSPEIFYEGWFGKRKWGRVLSSDEDKKHLTVTFKLSKALTAGKSYFLRINFSGGIRNDLYGFYRSSYKVGNETRWLATTHFEPTHARRAFPCFDEPNLRAEFDIRITHHQKHSALSNMPVETSESENDRITDKFQRTKKMSTYLVAFIVSEFKHYKTDDPISSVYASDDFIEDAAYSQQKGVEAVKEMEEFTNIKFSLPKIDHVAVPDFPIGAMENWGLITYRDYLLIKRNESTTPVKQKVPTIIAHEVSHQWFGNLVAVEWWSCTWLKEGFATFFENYITEKITEGEFSKWYQFIPDAFQVALELDGNPATSVAMTSEASTPEEISARFDGITYQKAGSVLRMISEVLTVDKFRDGLRSYLTEKQYSSANPDDLFEQWEKVSSGVLPHNVNFTDFVKSWTVQGGVPVVNATRNYETGEVTFSQQRHYDSTPGCGCGQNRRWWVPLTWITQNEDWTTKQFKPEAWLNGDEEDEKLVKKINIGSNEWLLLNLGSVGYFRINYDSKNWELLTKSLTTNPLQFPIPNKAQIINDAFFLASSGQVDFATALGTLNFLSKEGNASVWKSATRIITKLVDELGPTEAYSLLEEYWSGILDEVYSKVGLKPDPQEKYETSLLRYHIAPWACLFGVMKCVKDATENLERHKDDLKSIHPDVITPTLCGAVRGANERAFWDIRKRVATISRTNDKMLIISALGKCQPDDHLIKRHLEETLQEKSVIPEDLKKAAVQQVLVVPSKFNIGFEFVKENLEKLLNTLGKNDTTFLVVTLIKTVRTESQYQEVSDWLKANLSSLDDPENVTAELTASKSNTEWNALHLTDVANWLAATVGHEDPPSDHTDSPSGHTPPPTEAPHQPNLASRPENHEIVIKSILFIYVVLCIFPIYHLTV